ncbi:MAG: DUF3794 domain-containing protein [Clostridium sp.]
MGTKMRGLIEYNGINTCNYESMPNFKQLNIDFTFCVPGQKPDIEQIVKVWAKPCIVEQRLVKTPIGTSLEGQTVTGHKMMVVGDIDYKVEYVALEATQSLHTAHGTFPFCGYIVLPDGFNVNSVMSSSVAVEDIYSDQLDTRCIYNNITMMLIADLC